MAHRALQSILIACLVLTDICRPIYFCNVMHIIRTMFVYEYNFAHPSHLSCTFSHTSKTYQRMHHFRLEQSQCCAELPLDRPAATKLLVDAHRMNFFADRRYLTHGCPACVACAKGCALCFCSAVMQAGTSRWQSISCVANKLNLSASHEIIQANIDPLGTHTWITS